MEEGEECKDCPLVQRVGTLEQKTKDMALEVKQMRSETKQNEMAITRLSRDLVIFMNNSEVKTKSIESGINNINKAFQDHKEDERQTINTIKEHFNSTIKPINEKMKDFDGVKVQNKIMWSIMVSLGGVILSVFLFVAQQKYTEYQSIKAKQKYTLEERMEYLEFKAQQLRERQNEKSNN